MRRKVTVTKLSDRVRARNANINVKAKDNAANVKPLKLTKQTGKPTKTPTGKGLGKAGAKRLGRLLKRAIQVEESTTKENPSLPKTPVRLFKHQIQTEEDYAHKANTAKLASHHISQLILSVVTQCKHRGGISMSELKQMLAAGGYNVTKNKRQVKVATKRLIHDETIVRTTRSATFRLNNKKLTDTMHVRMSHGKSPKPNGELKQSQTASKSPKTAKTSHKALKAIKPKGKTQRQAAKIHKPRARTHKPAGKSKKKPTKTRKPRRKSQKRRRKAPKARRKPVKSAGKKHRSAERQVRKTARKAQRSWQRRPKQKQYWNKSSRKRPVRQRLPKTRSRLNTQQRRTSRRTSYY